MKRGDIGLVRIPGVVGRGIRAGQWAIGDGFEDYEHAVICTSVNDAGVPTIVQAMPGGAEMVRDWGMQGVLWVRPAGGLTVMQQFEIASAAFSYVNTPYSFLDYSAIALHRFHIPAPGLREYIADTGHMICSQLVDRAYQDAGIQLFDDGRWNGYVTPANLWDLFWTRKLVLAA